MQETYITKKIVLQIINDFLNPVMEKKGFIYNKSKEAYCKKVANQTHNIYIAVKSFWPLKQEINIVLSVTYNDINAIILKFYKKHLDHHFDKDHDLISKRQILPNSNELEFKELYTLEDIELVCPEILSIIENNAISFFSKYSNYITIANEYLESYENKWYKYLIYVLIAQKISKDERYLDTEKLLKQIILNENINEDESRAILKMIEYLDEKY